MWRTTISIMALLALTAAGFALASGAPASTTRSSTDIKPYTAPSVAPVKPHTSKTITVDKPALPPKPLSFYFRTWKLGVPGGAYVTPGPLASSTDTLHVSAGTGALHQLTIRADHTWTWGSASGKWRSTGQKDYPILLVAAYEGDNWTIGYDNHNDGRIFAWDKQASWWLYGKP